MTVSSDYDIYKYSNGLNRHILTVATISGPHHIVKPSLGTISPVMNLHGWQKALWKSRPVSISQWRQ